VRLHRRIDAVTNLINRGSGQRSTHEPFSRD
jgi:hypothetical protein